MKKLKWAAMYPLIGGFPIGAEKITNSLPEYVLSTPGFQENDKHYINWLRQNNWSGNYYIMDAPEDYKSVIENATFSQPPKVDLDFIVTTCPCAGLSSLSNASSADNSKNDFMINSTRYILENLQPKVLVGENAPRLATKLGKPVADALYEVCKETGYTLLLYSTESRLHGNPQIRPRTFYFMFKKSYFSEDGIPYTPVLEDIPFETADFIEYIKEPQGSPKAREDENVALNKHKPSEEPYFKYISEHLGLSSHEEIVNFLCNESTDFKLVNTYGLAMSIDKGEREDIPKKFDLLEWLESNEFPLHKKRVEKAYYKAENELGGVWMHHDIIAVKEIPSYVAQIPAGLIHPTEDRYCTMREGMRLMGLPEDFNIVYTDNIRKQSNFICQNVPTGTAGDMISEIVKMISGTSKKLHNAEYVLQRKKQRDTEVIIDNSEKADINKFF